ncbi:hypothetical protein [Clostridium botulinum]|uniref:hypothetical protein n=1 Tax=Clostridium botulinum TaxID=1491 RepID=UPI001E35BAAF|nr:hypothetical protein [Clostridium botulinum]MCD3277321.1 hypothetical protein [Clostridium botulinum C/D]MCD3289076.1 hypothetical protein [Clostridium botulinum C/D]MCD3291939.1 hypothetical protein [Clostridium botulinum C/D]MCD3304131.1 hypothetical protein [Clostridium botulinum C/D]
MDIGINNLKAGEEFKNYKTLCDCINVTVKKGGRNLKLQKQDLKRYFDWITEGRKIIIKEVYLEPKPKVDNRKNNGKSEGSRGNNNIYGKYVDNILIDYFIEHLKEHDNIVLNFTNREIAELTGMINLNYNITCNDKDNFYKYLFNSTTPVTRTAIRDVFRKVQNILKYTIDSSLNRLQKQGYIKFNKGYLLLEKQEDKNKTINRYAYDIETKAIRKVENDVLKEMGITIAKKNYNDKLRKEYYKTVNERVKKVFKSDFDIKIKSYWISYRIDIKEIQQVMNFTNTQLDEIDSLEITDVTKYRELKEFKVNSSKLKQELNELIIQSVKSKINKEKIDIEQEINNPTLGLPNPIQPKWIIDRIDGKYIQDIEHVIKYVLQLNAKSIKFELENIKAKEKIKEQKQQNQDNDSWLNELD